MHIIQIIFVLTLRVNKLFLGKSNKIYGVKLNFLQPYGV